MDMEGTRNMFVLCLQNTLSSYKYIRTPTLPRTYTIFTEISHY